VQLLPKIDLHRHLLGSVRPETLWELGQKQGMPAGISSREALMRAIVHRKPVVDLDQYINPWDVFRNLVRTPEAIRRIAAEAATDARLDGVTYVEFRTSLTGMGVPQRGLPQAEISTDEYLDAIRQGFAEASLTLSRLVVSLPRHVVGRETPAAIEAYQAKFFSTIQKFRDEFIVGVDLTGIETGWPASQFTDFFKEARALALPVTIHAGETEGPREIWTAIDELGASRIGHGTSAWTDASLVAALVKRGIALEVCPTTSRLIGNGKNGAAHPIIESKLPIPYVICTDNPTVNNTTMSNELSIAAGMLQTPPAAFIQSQFEIASRAAFSPIATVPTRDPVAPPDCPESDRVMPASPAMRRQKSRTSTHSPAKF
jgi:adenosine deaminase